MTEADGPRTIRAVERASAILDALEREGTMGVTAVAGELDISKGTVHTYLTTLARERLVTKDPDGYRLSLHYLNLAERVTERIDIYDIAKAEVDKLAEQTGERAQFAMLEGTMVANVYRAEGADAIRTTVTVGQYDYPHYIAVGKAILAFLPEERRDRILRENGLPEGTERSITDRAELEDHLARVHDQGYAIDDEERARGVRCVGAPLRDETGTVLGAISISGPAQRVSDERIEEDLVGLLLRSANVIEVNAELAT